MTEEPPALRTASANPLHRTQAEHCERTAWIDIAKSVAILLIVVYHVTSWFAMAVAPAVFEYDSFVIWRELSKALVPVRIPLFFLTAGLLAHRAIRRPWRALVRTRLATLLWVFTLWTLLIAVPWSYRVSSSEPTTNASMAVQSLLFAGTHFWFLPALVIFLSAAKLLTRWPVATVIASVLASTVVVPVLAGRLSVFGPVLGVNAERWMIFGMWFMAGCFAARLVGWISQRSAWWLVLSVSVFLGCWLLVPAGGVIYQVAVLSISVSGVASMILMSRLLARWANPRRVGVFIARRTLAIYVVHALVLELIAVAIASANASGAPVLLTGWPVAALFVPVTTAVAVSASIGVFAIAQRSRVLWLFEAPRALAAPVAGQGKSTMSS